MGHFDVVIVGAGAAGLMCAAVAGKRGRKVLLLDHAKAPGEKIRISGGGRCNFTNIHTTPGNFLSQNKHFAISALQRFKPKDFIGLVEKHDIAYHEKTLGQLFCDGSSRQIVDMLLAECHEGQVTLKLQIAIAKVNRQDNRFILQTSEGMVVTCHSLVVATGGLSIPKMGATGWGYDLARQFGLAIIPTRAGLVPFTMEGSSNLSGIALDSIASFKKTHFREGMLFTHKGLSGPSILQISSYWQEGEAITINMVPGHDMAEFLKAQKAAHPKQDIVTALAQHLPKRLAEHISEEKKVTGRLADLSNNILQLLADRLNRWKIIPEGTEGYRTAEVTLGGIDTKGLSSQTMEALHVPGLYFIGEVVDVTGHLGGFNFQWAWASGHAAGQYV